MRGENKMSKVEPKVNWSCDSAYLITTEDQYIGTDRFNNKYLKYNSKPAIAVKVRTVYDNSIVLLSTIQDAVFITPLYLSFISGKAIIDGTTWYMGSPLYSSMQGTDPSPELRWLEGIYPILQENDILINKILIAANVRMEESDYGNTF